MLCLVYGAALAPAADPNAPPTIVPFDQLPDHVQRVFDREATAYIRVRDRIWSIDTWQRRERIPVSLHERRDPYVSPNAPLFYDPVRDIRAPSLGRTAPALGDVALIYGALAGTNGEVAWINTVHGLVYVMDLPGEPQPDSTQRVLYVVQPAGEANLKIGDETRTAPAARVMHEGQVDTVIGAELADYFQRHGVDRFEQWRFRKVWDEKPQARKVYRQADRVVGPGVGMGTAEPGEVITNPGQYHYRWTRSGRRVPPMQADESTDDPNT